MKKKKMIIDTDPGIDDALAIIMAAAAEEVELLGLTTCFGNVPTALATDNALMLIERLGRRDVPVAAGADAPLSGSTSKRIADFVHGKDGMGNTYQPGPSDISAVEGISGAEFIVSCCREHPGEVTLLCIGNMTNLALAFQNEPELDDLIGEVVAMGGAFEVNGNVNPAAEANIFSDADAAEYVLQRCSKMKLLPLDCTSKCFFSREDLESLRGKGTHGSFIWAISQFYLAYHERAFDRSIILLHDPAALVVALDNSLVEEWQRGGVVVGTEGSMKGKTILDMGQKNWVGSNPWIERPKVEVALRMDSDHVRRRCLQLLTAI